MVEKYFGGTLPVERAEGEFDADLISAASALRGKYEAEMEHFQFQNALEAIFKVIQRANKYIDATAPWVLAKDEANRARLASVMYNLLETIRICTILLTPFIPASCEKIFAQIGAAALPRLGQRRRMGPPEARASPSTRARPSSPASTRKRRWPSWRRSRQRRKRPRFPRWRPSL